MAEFTLFIGNKNYSSWSLRGWLACKLAGIDFEEALVRLDPLVGAEETQGRLRSVSPAGRVPVLRHGDLLIWDTMSIGEYLAELFPAKGLWPADRAARALARSIAAEMHSGFGALRNQLPMNMRRVKPPPAIDDAARADIARVQAIWRDCRQRFGRGGAYLFGAPTLADAFYAPVVSRFTTYGVALDGGAAAYCAAMWQWPALEAWREAALKEPWIVAEDEV
jgi:glutathione S-transferase